MDSITPAQTRSSTWSAHLSGWSLARGRDIDEMDAIFGAGIALKSLDDLIRSDPPWLGCWRDRLALKSAAVAAKMLGRNEDEHALRDAILLTAKGNDPGPAESCFWLHECWRAEVGRSPHPLKSWPRSRGMKWDDSPASIPDIIDSASQSGRAAPFVVAGPITAISAVRPDAEVLALGLGELVLAQKLNWSRSIPLLQPKRSGPAFRTIDGRGSVRPGERLTQKRSAWHWSTVSRPHSAPRSRSIVGQRDYWLWR